MEQNKKFQKEHESVWQELSPGIERVVLGYNDNLMMVKVKMKAGCIGELHAHDHIQTSYIGAGSFDVTIDGKTIFMEKGDSFFVEANLVHGVVCKQDGLLVDVFSPCRVDFL